jgi:hypothetical protein
MNLWKVCQKFNYGGKIEVFRNCIHEECSLPFYSKSFVLPLFNLQNIKIKEADPGGRAVSAAA